MIPEKKMTLQQKKREKNWKRKKRIQINVTSNWQEKNCFLHLKTVKQKQNKLITKVNDQQEWTATCCGHSSVRWPSWWVADNIAARHRMLQVSITLDRPVSQRSGDAITTWTIILWNDEGTQGAYGYARLVCEHCDIILLFTQLMICRGSNKPGGSIKEINALYIQQCQEVYIPYLFN